MKNGDRVNLIFNSSKDMKKVNMSDILKDTITLIDGRGGGNQFAAQGGGKNNGNTEVAIDYATNKIRRYFTLNFKTIYKLNLKTIMELK